MFQFGILLSAVACTLGAALHEGMLPQLDGRVVGGSPTTIIEFPWQISLQYHNRHFCGGSIIAPNLVLTAAHCLEDIEIRYLKIRAGSSYTNRDGTLVAVTGFRRHEGYNRWTMDNDIAVIYLSSSLAMSSTIKVIPLSNATPAEGTIAVVSGWGRLSSGGITPSQLMYVALNIISYKKCSSNAYGYGTAIDANMLCTYNLGKDACQGDSGGPLVAGGALVGIVSWGYGCALKDYPGVYTNVALYRGWIKENAAAF